jgi:regulator of CtrA degradation
MSNTSNIEGGAGGQAVTVSFARRLAASEHFTAIFREGMALVERSAAYLDGEGRREAKELAPQVSVVYATESMRLTTRLLELASWLLIRRAFNEGEITEQEAALKSNRIKLRTTGRPSQITKFPDLPKGLQALIEESFALTDRVIQLDLAITRSADAEPELARNPVAAQLDRLQSAFAGTTPKPE